MKTTLSLILIVLTIGVLIYGFTVWQDYQEKEKQYQSCLLICQARFGQDNLDGYKILCNLDPRKAVDHQLRIE